MTNAIENTEISTDLSGAPIMPEPTAADIAAAEEMEADALVLTEEDEAILAAAEAAVLTDEDEEQAIEQAVAQAEAYEAQAPAEDEAEDQAIDKVVLSYDDAMAAVTDEDVTQLQAALATAIADRAQYERDANPNNDNIQKTLTKLVGQFSKPGSARVLAMTGVGEAPINRSEVANKRRNVYALEKMADLLYAAVTGHIKNAINNAVIVSMVRLNTAGVPFTGYVAKACASDKIVVDAQLKALLTSHTVSDKTASTQASSTMTALEDLGVVVNTGTRQFPVFTMIDTPLSRRLVEITASQHGQAAAA